MDPNNLKLSVAAYFGEVRLRSLHSKMPSTVVSTTQDSYGNTIYQVSNYYFCGGIFEFFFHFSSKNLIEIGLLGKQSRNNKMLKAFAKISR